MSDTDDTKNKSEYGKLPEWPQEAKEPAEHHSATIKRNQWTWALGIGFLGSVFFYAMVSGAGLGLRVVAIVGGFLFNHPLQGRDLRLV